MKNPYEEYFAPFDYHIPAPYH